MHFAVPLDQTAIPADALFGNSVGGLACFAFAHRQMRAALLLLHFGFYEAVPPLLRLAFEAAECGQYLSKDPPAADRWFARPTSWPSKPVRSRLGDRTRHGTYGRHYGMLSELSHPTARAGMSSVELDEYALRPSGPRTRPDPERVQHLALVLASTAIFGCFAFINASPKASTEPAWRRRLKRMAGDLLRVAGADGDTDHLAEDWETAQTRWERVAHRMQDHGDLERALNEHPASWRRATNVEMDDHHGD